MQGAQGSRLAVKEGGVLSGNNFTKNTLLVGDEDRLWADKFILGDRKIVHQK